MILANLPQPSRALARIADLYLYDLQTFGRLTSVTHMLDRQTYGRYEA